MNKTNKQTWYSMSTLQHDDSLDLILRILFRLSSLVRSTNHTCRPRFRLPRFVGSFRHISLDRCLSSCGNMRFDLVCELGCSRYGIRGISRCFRHLDREAGHILRIAFLCRARGFNSVSRRLIGKEDLLDPPRVVFQVFERASHVQGSVSKLGHVELGR